MSLEFDNVTLGLASVVRLLSGAANSMDDVGPLMGGFGSSSEPVRGVRQWTDGTGKTVQVYPDGRLYYAGEFVGYRDTHGRITGGSGNLIGYLKDTGEYHGPNGDYMGRMFS